MRARRPGLPSSELISPGLYAGRLCADNGHSGVPRRDPVYLHDEIKIKVENGLI